jgi:hypothetical protein
MLLRELAMIMIVLVTGTYAFGAEPPAQSPAPATSDPESVPLHTGPYSVKCAPSVKVWVEVDSNSLPPRENTRPEAKKRIQLRLVSSTPNRGDAVLCRYANRGRDMTTSYSVRCIDPHKERGYRNSFLCR